MAVAIQSEICVFGRWRPVTGNLTLPDLHQATLRVRGKLRINFTHLGPSCLSVSDLDVERRTVLRIFCVVVHANKQIVLRLRHRVDHALAKQHGTQDDG